MKRRHFILDSSLYSLAFLGLKNHLGCQDPDRLALREKMLAAGYGPLEKDPEGILELPKGFTYRIISKKGNPMADGFIVPGLADGMATFPGKDGRVLIIRNHEVSPRDTGNGPFGKDLELLSKIPNTKLYDYGKGQVPCLGGTTTIVYNPRSNKIENEYLSLIGTIRNCAGGPTPWNTWISCEENTNRADSILEKDHGYNFEVPASEDIVLHDPEPLKEMGRFNHEAVCVDPRTGIVYQTEDRPDGLIYRYIPNTPGQLNKGGRLQLLSLLDQGITDTRNWNSSKGPSMTIGQGHSVRWLDIDEIDAPDDDLRYRGAAKGGAVFARGEGMWFGKNEVFFACTNGGKKQHGQIFRYIPSDKEGSDEETQSPGTLDLFVEPNDSELVESCDNLTLASNGDLILCEDKSTPRIVGVTPDGKIYHLAKNVGYRSEFAGATFSPDGKILFVNIQGPGLTLAIQGPWQDRKA